MFIVKKAFIPLASRPTMFSLLRKRDQRTYKVIISDQTLNSYQLQYTGVFYLCGAFRASMEKGTDMRTIEHGLGWQLLEYAEHVRELSGSFNKQTDFMDKYCMNPEDIRMLINRSDLYKNDDR